MNSLADVSVPLETWVVLPLLFLAFLALSVALRAPQVSRLVEGWRGLRGDPGAPGEISAGAAVALSVAASTAAGAVVGTATAISLGGPGAVAWLWLFGLLIAPIRYAEVLLSRSAPPGKAGMMGASGSLSARLSADPHPRISPLGGTLGILVPVAALVVVGGLHGTALAETAEHLLPGSAISLSLLAAAAGVALWLVPQARSAIGWIGLAAFITLGAALLLAIVHDVGRSFSLFPRALDDAFSGSAEAGAFTGALVQEITRAGIRYGLPPLSSTIGVDGALHAHARATGARTQAATAVAATMGHVIVVTLVGMAIVGTGAFSRRTDDERRLSEITWVDASYETVSQRLEEERRWTGYLRVVDGEMSGDPRPVGIERGMVSTPRFVELDGTPADFALRIREGRITSVLRRDADGALDDAPEGEADRIRVTGTMLPRGAGLILAAVRRGGGDLAERLLLAALVLLSALAVAGWGAAARSALVPELGEGPARAGLGIAALGLVVGASGLAPFLRELATIFGGVLAVVAVIGILAKLRDLTVLAGAASATTASHPAASKPASKKTKPKRS